MDDYWSSINFKESISNDIWTTSRRQEKVDFSEIDKLQTTDIDNGLDLEDAIDAQSMPVTYSTYPL